MKKLNLFFVIACCVSTCYSQGVWLEESETSNDKIRWGVKFGIAISNPAAQYLTDTIYGFSNKTSSRTGIMGGFFLRAAINKKIYLQPEMLMVSKGIIGFDGRGKSFTYLEFPINLLYNSNGFLIGGGPALAYLIGTHYYYYSYANDGGGFRKFDMGINFLAIYEAPIGFSINLHYTYGLLNTSNNKAVIPVSKNRCFGITVGYLF